MAARALGRLLALVALSSALASGPTSVLVLRHCLRSTPSTAYGAPGFNDLGNYSSRPLPPWPVPAYQCLPEGLVLIQRLGTQLAPLLGTPLQLRVDTAAKRDNDTAAALLRGMGLPETYTAAPELFDPVAAGLCDALPLANQTAALRARMAAFPPPRDHLARLGRMQAVLGDGAAPAMDKIPDSLSGGYLIGGSSVAGAWAEAFLMQLGGLLPSGCPSLAPEQVHAFLAAHIYLRGVQDRAAPLVARSHSYMAVSILEHLQRGNGTLVLVGHDGDLDALAALYGLSWHTPPFPPNATTPGSALRLDMTEGASVRASVLYQNFEPAEQGKVHTAAAVWSETGADQVRLEQLQQWLAPKLDANCMPSAE